MAQGAVKKSSQSLSLKSNKKSKPAGPKRGAKVIKPKKASLVQRNKMIKKHSAGLQAATEKHLAERAGHLELLSGGKKKRDEKSKNAAKQGGRMQ